MAVNFFLTETVFLFDSIMELPVAEIETLCIIVLMLNSSSSEDDWLARVSVCNLQCSSVIIVIKLSSGLISWSSQLPTYLNCLIQKSWK